MIYDPFDEIAKMHEEMDKMFGRFFGGSSNLLGYNNKNPIQKNRTPLADIRETESSVLATFELPGAKKEDIELNVTDTKVEVKVQGKVEKEKNGKDSYYYESMTSNYYRALPLPAEVDPSKADAEYKDGVLRVDIPKLKKIDNKGKNIRIK